MTKRPVSDREVGDRPAFEITEEMVEAGVWTLRQHQFGEPLANIVRDILTLALAERGGC